MKKKERRLEIVSFRYERRKTREIEQGWSCSVTMTEVSYSILGVE